MEVDIFQGTDLTNSTDSLAFNDTPPTNGSVDGTTGPNNPPHPTVQALLTLFYICGIAGNVAALIILRRNENPRNTKRTLMLKCLAANDLLAVSGSVLQNYLHFYSPQWFVYDRYFCGVRVFWRAFGLGSGCVALTMAVERWVALTKPFFYQKNVTFHVIFRFILGLWSLVIVLSCLPFFGFGLYYDNNQPGYKRCSRYRFGTSPGDVAYAYMWFGFGLTMCVLIVACNCGVIIALYHMKKRSEKRRITSHSLDWLNRSSKRAQNDSSTGSGVNRSNSNVSNNSHLSVRKQNSSQAPHHQSQHQTQEEIKFARLMAVLCLFYVGSWCPQLVSIPIGISNPTDQDRTFFRIADICIALNFVLDPFIYVLLRGKCGRWFHCLCDCLCPCGQGITRESSFALQLTNDGEANKSSSVHTGSLPNRNGQEPNETNYVPLKTLLADNTKQIP